MGSGEAAAGAVVDAVGGNDGPKRAMLASLGRAERAHGAEPNIYTLILNCGYYKAEIKNAPPGAFFIRYVISAPEWTQRPGARWASTPPSQRGRQS